MKTAGELTREQLADIVDQVQGLLYLDLDQEDKEFWNPDKSWNVEFLDDIARKLAECGMVPTDTRRQEARER
jgi:hypothetical protein